MPLHDQGAPAHTVSMAKGLVAYVGPVSVLVVWIYAASPQELGLTALLGVPGAVLAVMAAWLALGDRPVRAADGARDPWYLLLWLGGTGAVLTVVYWQRVWGWGDWEMEGIPVFVAEVVGFWWLSVLHSALVAYMERLVLRRANVAGAMAARVLGSGLGALTGMVLVRPFP